MSYKLSGMLRFGEKYLCEHGIEDYRFDALQLLLHASGINETALYMSFNDAAADDLYDKYLGLLERRALSEPLQYIIGKWDFYKSEFFLGQGVLIPRPETEQLTDMCISRVKSSGCKTVYDLCAGSGCIGLSVAKECPEVDVYLFELYDDAFFYLEKNKKNLALNNAFTVKADIKEAPCDFLPSPDLIVSNPPYIRTADIVGLQKEVLREPSSALDGGEDGFVFYRAIAEKWLPVLNADGFVAVECGEEQAVEIECLFAEYTETSSVYDMFGVKRFVTGVKK